MDASQQWQLTQPVTFVQPQKELIIPQQWQTYQPSNCALPSMMPSGGEAWPSNVSAMTSDQSPSMKMVPMPMQPSFAEHSFPVNGMAPAVGEPVQSGVAHGYLPGLVQCSEYSSNAPQLFMLVPLSLGDANPALPQSWQHAQFCGMDNCNSAQPAAPPMTSASPLVASPYMVSDIEGIFSRGREISHIGSCSRDVTPERDYFHAAFKNNDYILRAPEVQVPAQLNLAQELDDFKEIENEQDGALDDISDCDFPEDLAMSRDSKSYASSETSTAVSRSARRRRGRRAAKAKAKTNSLIAEAPEPDDLLITEEKKNELTHQLEAGVDEISRAVETLTGSMLRVSMEPMGCRIVQMVLDVASMAEKESLVTEFHDHVRLAISSPHANFVIQKIIEVLPVNSTNFVADELAGFAAEVARHRFGCRILSRLVEHHLCGSGSAPATNALIDEVLREADQLIHHNFARHVLELILEHGTDAHKRRISQVVRANLFNYSKNRFASYVVEKALALCNPQDTHPLASELLGDYEKFITLAVHECGTHVVRAVMRLNADFKRKAEDLLCADVSRSKSTKYGKRLFDDM
jgi:hypothetical protein